MNRHTQKEIAEKSEISQSYLSEIVNKRKCPSWRVANRIAQVTSTEPILWLAGTTEQMRAVLSDRQSP